VRSLREGERDRIQRERVCVCVCVCLVSVLCKREVECLVAKEKEGSIRESVMIDEIHPNNKLLQLTSQLHSFCSVLRLHSDTRTLAGSSLATLLFHYTCDIPHGTTPPDAS
jgi:hypothetical protein